MGTGELLRAIGVCLVIGLGSAVAAAEPVAGSAADEVQAAHEALRALKQDAEQAFNRMGASGKREDFNVLLDYVTDDVVPAAMNGQFAVGKLGCWTRALYRAAHWILRRASLRAQTGGYVKRTRQVVTLQVG